MMNQEMMKEKIEALGQDEAFIAKLKVCETAEEICALYAQEGIEITPEELDKAIEANLAESDEFSEDDLDNVAGGIVTGGLFLAYSVVYFCVTCQSAYVLGKNSKKKKK